MSIQSNYSSDSRYQQSFSSSYGNVTTSTTFSTPRLNNTFLDKLIICICQTDTFPIKGVLKRSKSFGNNRNSDELNSSLLNDTSTGRFLLSLEGLSWENLTLIKQALDNDTCASLSMTQLLQIIRILCNKVLEKPTNAKLIAQVCMEIHQKQQMKMTSLSDHKYLFLESLTNCLREWFNERDKLRFTTGGARRWTGYMLFLIEMYLNLKTIDFVNVRHQMNDSSEDSDDNRSNPDNNSIDEEVYRAFSNDFTSDCDDFITCRVESNDIKKQTSLDIETKIINSVLSKQQKQFSNLLLDSFQMILANPNSTPAEIECMQTAFRKCGKYISINYFVILVKLVQHCIQSSFYCEQR